jgi:uncharacterized protein (DUF697 family)/tellurite resistance protein
MNNREIEAVGAICVLAALADGAMSEREREHVRAAFEGAGDGAGDGSRDGVDGGGEARALAAAYRRAMLKQTDAAQEARELSSPEIRQYAFEMAVAVCDADGRCSDAERRFLETLRAALALDAAASSAVVDEADRLADFELAAPSAAAAVTATQTVDAGAAGAAGAAVAAETAGAASGAMAAASVSTGATRDPSAEVDASILKYAILNGALELLPQGLATMAIVPLQMKMVYAVGRSYGVSLDRGHIKEFIATIGVGMTSQVVENFARDLLGGLAKKFLGKTAGKMVKTATGAAMSFATTYALGQVAKQYYAGGRRLSSVDLRALFGREVERAKALYAQHRPEIEQSAKTLDAKQVLSMVRGG